MRNTNQSGKVMGLQIDGAELSEEAQQKQNNPGMRHRRAEWEWVCNLYIFPTVTEVTQ